MISGIVIVTAIGLVAIFAYPYLPGGGPEIKPQITVASLTVKSITDKLIKVDAKVHLDNPMPFEISTKHVDYDVSVNGSPILRDRHLKPLAIESNQSTVITLPLEIFADSLKNVLKEMEKRNTDSVDFVFHASIRLDAPVAGETTFEYEESKKLPAFRPLDINPKNLDVEDFSWEKSTLTLKAELENHNAFPMKMQDVRYEFRLDNEHVLTGSIDGRTQIAPQSTTVVPVKLRASNKELGKLAWKALFDKDDTPFEIKYSCTLVSDNEAVNGTPLEIQISRVMKDINKLPLIP